MACRAVLLHAAAAAVCLAPLPARAQTTFAQESDYEYRYGQPVDVSIGDLEQNPDPYIRRAVRTHGYLELDMGKRQEYLLRDSMAGGAMVKIVPFPELSAQFQRQEHANLGQEVEVTGVVNWMPDAGDTRRPGQARVQITFWSFNADPRKQDEKKAIEVSLESLVRAPGKRDGQLVRVVGQFRGGNLYGDLPNTSRRAGGDWVIKNDAFAVWVMGKRPKGDGFDLDRASKADTGRWLEVVGRPFTRKGITWIQAVRVAMASPPAPAAPAAAVAEVQARAAPMIVFAAPVDGDDEVAIDSRFSVQFSKDMDESSFQRHVVLRYTGPAQANVAPIATMTFAYDPGRRTLIVDPGAALAPRRPLELLLLPGIVDVEGLALAPRPSAAPSAVDGAVEVLRYSTGS